MKREYHYLIASLPELLPNESYKQHPFSEYFEFCKEELAPEDNLELGKCFIFNDIINICTYKKDDDPYAEPCVYSKEQFEDNLNDTDQFFPFIAEFLYNKKEGKRRFPKKTEQDELLLTLYEQLDEFASGFVHDYLLFELHCRSICTALGNKTLGLEYKKRILQTDYISNQIAHNTASDFGLAGELGVFAPLVDMFGKEDPIDIEKKIDEVRWEWLDEYVSYNSFSSDAVFAYAVKLISVERWLKLQPEYGRMLLERIINTAKQQSLAT